MINEIVYLICKCFIYSIYIATILIFFIFIVSSLIKKKYPNSFNRLSGSESFHILDRVCAIDVFYRCNYSTVIAAQDLVISYLIFNWFEEVGSEESDDLSGPKMLWLVCLFWIYPALLPFPLLNTLVLTDRKVGQTSTAVDVGFILRGAYRFSPTIRSGDTLEDSVLYSSIIKRLSLQKVIVSMIFNREFRLYSGLILRT